MKLDPQARKIASLARKTVAQVNDANAGSQDFPSDLGGLCFLASRFLTRVLRMEGHPAVFVAGSVELGRMRAGQEYRVSTVVDDLAAAATHCWVECDGYIIDITATQFTTTCRPVFVCPTREAFLPTPGGGYHYVVYGRGRSVERMLAAEWWWPEPHAGFGTRALMRTYRELNKGRRT